MTGEPEGLQPRADQEVEAAATAPEPDTDSAPTEESTKEESSTAAPEAAAEEPAGTEPVASEPPVEEPSAEVAAAEETSTVEPVAEAPAVEPVSPASTEAFSSAPSLPKPKPLDLPPAIEPALVPAASSTTENQPIVPPDEGGLPGLPSADAADEVSEEELKAIDEAVYQHLIEEASAGVSPASEGERRDGTVVSVTEDAAVIDIGGKAEAILPRSSVQQESDWAALEAGASIAVVVVGLGAPGARCQGHRTHQRRASGRS